MLISLFNGIKEIGFELLNPKHSFKRRLFRVSFRFQTIRNFKRSRFDIANNVETPSSPPAVYLAKHGYYSFSLKLDSNLCKKINNLIYVDDNTKAEFKGLQSVLNDPQCYYGRYTSISPHNTIDEISEIARSPAVLEIVNSYLGENAVLSQSVCWITRPSSLPESHFEYGFHMDVADWKWLNLFIYLTDVDIDSGPHMCIDGTHTRRHFTSGIERRISDRRAVEVYGANSFITFVGPAGTALFEDTGNYHSARKVKFGYRHMLQLNFASTNSFDLQ